MSKSSFIVPVLLIIGCLVGISYLSYNMYKNGHGKASTCVKLHPYDYIIEVDGTDSISVYHLFDNNHNEIGSFTGSNCDSLDLLILEDNL